jgi:hypothetical protein
MDNKAIVFCFARVYTVGRAWPIGILRGSSSILKLAKFKIIVLSHYPTKPTVFTEEGSRAMINGERHIIGSNGTCGSELLAKTPIEAQFTTAQHHSPILDY